MANLTSVTLTAGVPTAGTGTVGTIDNVTGTAGAPSTPVLTVQGVASGTPQPVSGTVAISGTVPVSLASAPSTAVTNAGTFATQLTGATNNINNVAGTVSLPTGASTSANQPTNAAIASTTAAQTGHLAMGAVTTAAPTYTTAQTNPLSLDTAGNLRVNVVTGGGSGGTSSTFGSAFPGTGTAIGLTNGTNMVGWSATTTYGTAPAAIAVPAVNAFLTNANANGQTTMSASAPVVIASNQSAVPTTTATATTGGTSTSKLIAANTTNATSLKTSAGTLYGVQVFNNSATIGYLKLYNKASSPTVGTDTPVKVIMIPASSGAAIPIVEQGVAFGTGIAYAVTGGIADTDTTAVAASAFIINIDYA
jgi:hypothetical protein